MNGDGRVSGQPPMPDQVGAVAALIPYVTALRSHLRLVVAIVALTVIAALAWTRHEGTKYEATSSILVSPVPADDVAFSGLPVVRGGEADTTRAVQTAATLLHTGDIAARAAARSSVAPGTVSSAVKVEARPSADLVEITATSEFPELAAKIANTYAHAALQLRAEELRPLIAQAKAATRQALDQLHDPSSPAADELRARLGALSAVTGDPAFSFAHKASVPTDPTGPPTWLVLAFALVAGLTLAAVTATLGEVLAPRKLRDEDDLATVFPWPVLARMPDLPRRPPRSERGRRRASAVREALRSVRGQLEVRAAERQPGWLETRSAEADAGSAVLITSPSRGAGSRGVARGLARAFSARDASVIMIEADLHDRATGDAGPESGGLRRLAEGAALADALEPMAGISTGGVLSAPRGLGIAEIEWINGRVPAMIAECTRYADWVVVHAPPLGTMSDAIPIVSTVDDVVVVVRRNHTGMIELTHLRELVRQLDVVPLGYVLVGGVRIREPHDDYSDDEEVWSFDRGEAPSRR